ncbi:hypothetical protein [Sediminivirga luteola]|uniref:hypothetical protein n=1 Tax=Sediminivirga luteola TaxID=1774748 RepID=UPI001F5A320A|nr:hypothetical protein [Sediminivirga luteola]MCI2266671.1 hypothetical protein [Sediminivirga luteola]
MTVVTVSFPAAASPSNASEPFIQAVPSLEDELLASDGASRSRSTEAALLISGAEDRYSEVVEQSPSGAEFVEHPDGVTTVTVARSDGAVQALASFADEAASTEVIFEIAGELSWTKEGLVEVVEQSGESYTIAVPWAKDASGRDVPTHYEIRGGDLVQIVDHLSGEFDYPVVADPWLGVRLFTSFKRDRFRGDYRYSAWVTVKGAVILSGGGGVGGYAAGQAVFRNNGWAEWKAKWPKGVTNKKTLQQQYNCHVAAGLHGLPFTQDYNLERFRADKSDWLKSIATHRCNW